ncbi:S49 family peptidase [Gemmatimonas sp.]|uniref:S49 family peptidase n=1 Tax=Gemmatimonas sp. TaxID=1962908 RepID=UPI0025BA8698|nr:S49 family peptidase [Gemmatimonas sp.]MCA2992080.1 S49 family peptidase [Gemmatimonas sp.]
MPTRKRTTRQARHSRRQQVIGAVVGQPWGISPSGLERVLATAERLMASPTEAVSAEAEDGVEYSYRLTTRQGVGQIRVYGPLVSASSWLSWYYDSYGVLAHEITQALRDPAVKALVLTIDSPGGHVNGCQELARIIRAARGSKPIVAFIEGDACSAAYWIASACDEIVTAETSALGCLGAQVAYLDATKALEQWGLREIVITSSQTPEKNRPPVDDEGKRAWQQMVDDIADVFLGTVADYRGVTREDVDARFGQGAVLVGARAVAAGLADRVGTYEALHAELASGTWRGSTASDATPTAARAAQPNGEEPMPRLKRIGARRAASTAAAYEANAEVRSLVTRDVGIAEGDIGTVTEVRDGSFYRVQVGEGEDTYAWLAEDEIEAAASAPADEAPADASEDEESDETMATDEDEEETTARKAKPSAFRAALAAARTAERKRITGILALASRASLESLLGMVADPSCTPEAAAHRLLTGKVAGVRAAGLSQLAGDEADLTQHGGVSAIGEGPATQSDADRIVATTALFNPRAIARKPRG